MSARDDRRSTHYTRRRFLGAVGASAAGAATLVPGSLAASREEAAVRAASPDRFSRLFPALPPFAPATPAVIEALRVLGSPGGTLDAPDFENPDPTPLGLILRPGRNRDSTLPAGLTFLGEFIDHDVTFDATSQLGVAATPELTRNFRDPALNLDSVYGAGLGNSALVLSNGRMRLETVDPADPDSPEDLPRLEDGSAIIGDPRNDENLVIAGLHAAFLRFHNNALDRARTAGKVDTPALFAEARRLTTWHYQWIVLNEFLPAIAGRRTVEDIHSHGRRIYTSSVEGSIPVEFQIAYRMGHSLVRPSYRANFTGNGGLPFIAFIFDSSLTPPTRTTPAAVSARPAASSMADVLPLLRLRVIATEHKAARPDALDTALPPSALRDCDRRPAGRACAAKPAASPHLAAPVGTGDRAGDRGAGPEPTRP